MREIKFRAWDGEGMQTDFYVNHFGGVSVWRPKHSGFDEYEWPLMQYTGLKDKNDKEIYEGDIIDDCGDKYEVIFHKGTFCYKMLEHEYHLFGDTVEIIGNIYENPELLTK